MSVETCLKCKMQIRRGQLIEINGHKEYQKFNLDGSKHECQQQKRPFLKQTVSYSITLTMEGAKQTFGLSMDFPQEFSTQDAFLKVQGFVKDAVNKK